MKDLSDDILRKFTDVVDLGDDWEIESDSGWSPISKIMQTVEYEIYRLELENGDFLECADDHIIFLSNGAQSFVKDLTSSDYVKTKSGASRVLSVVRTGIYENMYDVQVDTESHSYYSNNILSHNTTTVAAFILWYILFHPEKNCAVLANKADQALEIMSRIRLMYEELPFFLQQGALKYNFGEILLENKSGVFSGSSNPDTVRGQTLNLVYWDEAAFTARDEEFWTSTFPVLSTGKTAKIILTSTPKGARGVFYNIYKGAVAEGDDWNGFHPLKVIWSENPTRDEAWKESTIKKFGQTKFLQEHCCEFLSSAGALIPSQVLQRMQFANPLNSDEYLSIYQRPKPDRSYYMVVDSSEGLDQDYSVCTVFDITTLPYTVVAVYRNNLISPLLLPYQIMSMAETYNNCYVLIEANNSQGTQVGYILYYDLEYENVILTSSDKKTGGQRIGGNSLRIGVLTTNKVKMVGCSNLRILLETDSLVITDSTMIEELGTFIAKGNSYAADEGCNDDTVMTLVLFAWSVKQSWFTEYTNINIQEKIYEQNIDALKAELVNMIYTNANQHTESINTFDFSQCIKVYDGNSGISFQQWASM